MDRTKILVIVTSILVGILLIVNASLLYFMLQGKPKTAASTSEIQKSKETLIYDVKGGEAITANLKSKNPKELQMMLRVSVTIEYEKGSFFKKPITKKLTEKEKVIESIITDTIKSTYAEDVVNHGEKSKIEFTQELTKRLKEEFGKDVSRVFISEFIYN